MKKKVLIILMISIVFGFATGYSLHHLIHFNQKQEEMVLLPEHPFYLLDEVNEEVLYNTLKHYDFPNPAIITAQAVLESGNFKSKLCKDNNNLFGLYNSRTMSYFKFDSWISCVFAYKQFILSKYNPEEDYYKFLDRIGYAEDSLYESKVKELELDILNKYGRFHQILMIYKVSELGVDKFNEESVETLKKLEHEMVEKGISKITSNNSDGNNTISN